MSHKDAPPETESQKACREWWEKARPTVKRAWGRAQDGSFLAEETRLIHQSWEAASKQANAEVERLRAEVTEWKRVAAAQAELHGEAEARAERLAEALRKVVQALEWFAHGRLRGFDDGPLLSTSEAVELAERTLLAEEDSND